MGQLRSVVCVFSGGLDSTVMLYEMLRQYDEVRTLSFDYGQRHRRELVHGATIAARVGSHPSFKEHWVADVSAIAPLLAGSSQTSPEIPVPRGHYEDESMRATVVPARNMIMLAIATGWAVSKGAGAVAYGAHAGDHAVYPDCRPQFIEAMGSAMGLADYSKVQLISPFADRTKADIVIRGACLEVPFGDTWSCYEGLDRHCGACGTCVERIEAFQVAHVADPTEYLTGRKESMDG